MTGPSPENDRPADARPEDAAPRGAAARLRDHAVPLFEGARSRRHVRRGVRGLRVRALWLSLRHRQALSGAAVFAQFAGWPRSGHSLIGALIDAHPQAAIAHELDAMGLFRKGLPPRALAALCLGNAAAFTAAGRHWNGFRYRVPGAPHGPAGRLRVLGDKKGDWATRWSAACPGLPAGLAARSPFACRWILVTRHPADNIATMSLRRGRDYDRLRIARPADLDAALRRAQAEGRIADRACDAMIDDYAALAAAAARMKASLPPESWTEIVYERFVAAPGPELERLAGFLGLDPDPAWRDAAAGLVRPSARRSRDSLAWRDDQRARIAALTATHDFLAPYGDDV